MKFKIKIGDSSVKSKCPKGIRWTFRTELISSTSLWISVQTPRLKRPSGDRRERRRRSSSLNLLFNPSEPALLLQSGSEVRCLKTRVLTLIHAAVSFPACAVSPDGPPCSERCRRAPFKSLHVTSESKQNGEWPRSELRWVNVAGQFLWVTEYTKRISWMWIIHYLFLCAFLICWPTTAK